FRECFRAFVFSWLHFVDAPPPTVRMKADTTYDLSRRRPYNTPMKSSRLLIGLLFTCLLASAPGAQRRVDPTPDALSFRFLGPVVGNRVASIAGIPGDPSIYYAGAASGGVWKTTDGGLHW